MTQEPPEGVDLRLAPAEAIVLFEWLRRLEDADDDLAATGFDHPAEPYVLTRVLGSLEKALVQPFAPDWRDLLAAARAELAGRAGDVGETADG